MTQHPTAAADPNDLQPEILIPAARDAIAALRAMWTGGIPATDPVIAQCDQPRHVALYLAAFTRIACVRAGLDDATFDALMSELQTFVADFWLDAQLDQAAGVPSA